VITIRRQLTRKLLLATAIPLLVGGAIAFALIRDELIEQFDAVLEAQTLAVTAVTRVKPDGGVDVDASSRIMRDFDVSDAREHDEDETPALFEIRRADGSPVARSSSLGSSDLPTAQAAGPKAHFWNLVLPSGVAARAATLRFQPVPASGDIEPEALTVVVAVDRRDLDATVQTIALVMAAFGAVLLMTTFFVVPRVIRREFVPIETLANEAGRITADSLGSRFSTDALPGELLPIGHRLNDLLGRLEASFERERRFSADLAHELRTPLAELRSLAELAMKWPESRGADVDRDVLAIATQMEAIVSRLLAMLRSEHGQTAIALEHIDAAALARELWESAAARAATRGLVVTWDFPSSLVVAADPVLLRSILLNLLQNAVDYTPAGGHVTVGGRFIDTGFEITVRNDAGELSVDDVSRLFDRFWRRDASRSGGDHAGLGLSLARAFARTMGGDLTATLDSGRSLCLTLNGPTR